MTEQELEAFDALVAAIKQVGKQVGDVARRLQTIEDKIDCLDEKLSELDRVEMVRSYGDR